MHSDWAAISAACPDPLPTDSKALNELVMTHWPDQWVRHQFRHKWRRKKRKLRKAFVARLTEYRAEQKAKAE